jgi:hypothetical protein
VIHEAIQNVSALSGVHGPDIGGRDPGL